MKICPACHQETFNGRSTCHRCGSDVSRSRSLELPTADHATLHSRVPLRSKGGMLHLDVSGLRFTSASGRDLLEIPTRRIRAVEPRGSAEMILRYAGPEGADALARLRVRWAPRGEISPIRSKHEVMVVAHTFRAVMVSGGQRKRSARDKEIVRDRWLWSIETLLKSDRYAVGPRDL